MGIKGLYEELGSPDRVPLAKLSIDHLRAHKRHIRVAIDISIWSFQSQAVQGRNAGSNAALRVLYYRICTLLELNIHPVFVFDGKERPDFKRNKTVSKNEGYQIALTRRLIIAFGFPIHNAPGEAEAECAYLQQQGVVDAVLSEDVDTLMFGCSNFWRSGSDKKDSKSLDSLQVYTSASIRQKAKLTPHGMILVALMSGGDYDSAGVARIGIKQACAAAKAGYGEDLIKAYNNRHSDGGNAIRAWRERLETSLKTNSERIFTRRQPRVTIPEGFPDHQILEYYVNPKISKSPPEINWDIHLDIDKLRTITKAAFEWSGSGKLIRTLSDKLLSWRLGHHDPGADQFVIDIHQRAAGLKDGTPEKLRITYKPIDVVDLPYEHGVDNVRTKSADSTALLEDENGFSDSDGEDIRVNGVATTESAARKPPKTEYDPRINQRTWIYEEFVRAGASHDVQIWDENEAKKRAAKEKQIHEREQRSKAQSQRAGQNNLSQPKISAFYGQRKLIAKPAEKKVDAALDKADRKDIDRKENNPLVGSYSIKRDGASVGSATKTLKVVTRESLPGAWKAVTEEDEDKYDDKALDDVSICDLTDVQ
ncbi:Flap endonuclease [Drechslerella dactyloides]|uniref:Flap endonuclease n=1 Tax=Drechslerella dactyloides TaxID=74499 RepID=A0AAD6NF44_DREDA|nr:Flap endonuclease [Drechslerella dactyloides]